jgi:iron complex transport system ATP-binding protein
MIIVAVEQVYFAYQTSSILQDISFVIERGERISVLGPNESGKSMLLKVIHGALKPQRGRVLLDGRDIRTLRRLELARLIAVVPQEHQVAFLFTVVEMVLMGRTPYLQGWPFESQCDRDIVEWALECTGTSDLAGKPFPHLSSGEKQCVIVARAIAQRPKILLLDEFTASLDVRHQLELVSHDFNLAVRHSDRLALLDRGVGVAMGKPVTVLTPEHIRRVFGVDGIIDVHPITQQQHVMVGPLKQAWLEARQDPSRT